MKTTKELADSYLANTYAHFPLEITTAKGSYVYDEQGKQYIDMGTGIAVNIFGAADESWMQAVTAQLGKVQHTSNLYYSNPCAQLAQLLCERTGMKRVFFGNSGAEANECCIKVARKYASEKYGADRHVIVTLVNSFHGRTLTTLAATGQEHYHELFQPLTPGFVMAEAGDVQGLEELFKTGTVAGILMEAVQGEGGVLPLEKDYVTAVAALCEQYDVLLMFDEVQTGNGRSGYLYAWESFGVKPDVFSTAKGIGGGLPLGACIIGEKAEFALNPGDHGSTFGGNPVCCAGAIDIIKRLDDDMLAEVRKKSEYLFNELSHAAGVLGMSGMGLMIGIKTVRPLADVVKECREAGVLCLTAKDKLRLLPALNIPWDVLKQACETIKQVLAAE